MTTAFLFVGTAFPIVYLLYRWPVSFLIAVCLLVSVWISPTVPFRRRILYLRWQFVSRSN